MFNLNNEASAAVFENSEAAKAESNDASRGI